jgi:hypothetical protein
MNGLLLRDAGVSWGSRWLVGGRRASEGSRRGWLPVCTGGRRRGRASSLAEWRRTAPADTDSASPRRRPPLDLSVRTHSITSRALITAHPPPPTPQSLALFALHFTRPRDPLPKPRSRSSRSPPCRFASNTRPSAMSDSEEEPFPAMVSFDLDYTVWDLVRAPPTFIPLLKSDALLGGALPAPVDRHTCLPAFQTPLPRGAQRRPAP